MAAHTRPAPAAKPTARAAAEQATAVCVLVVAGRDERRMIRMAGCPLGSCCSALTGYLAELVDFVGGDERLGELAGPVAEGTCRRGKSGPMGMVPMRKGWIWTARRRFTRSSRTC
jgi:hypothetical protein